MEIDLTGRRVVITAAGSGIGRVIAETFAVNGATLYICDVSAHTLDEALDDIPNSMGCVIDVGDPDQVDRLMSDAVSALGGLDILIINAGIAGPTASVEDIETADWIRTIDVCLNAMFYTIRRAVPVMKAAGGGCIINMSSASGKLAFPMRAPYAVAKSAVNGLTNTLAAELGPANIRVNAILPGYVEGERADRVIQEKSAALGISAAEMEAKALQFIAMGTKISPREIAELAVFVASDAGRHISGQLLGIDGFMEMER